MRAGVGATEVPSGWYRVSFGRGRRDWYRGGSTGAGCRGAGSGTLTGSRRNGRPIRPARERVIVPWCLGGVAPKLAASHRRLEPGPGEGAAPPAGTARPGGNVSTGVP